MSASQPCSRETDHYSRLSSIGTLARVTVPSFTSVQRCQTSCGSVVRIGTHYIAGWYGFDAWAVE